MTMSIGNTLCIIYSMLKSCTISITLLLLLSCEKPHLPNSTCLIADSIETLCYWRKFDTALEVYNLHLGDVPISESYLNRLTALKLFSHTNQKTKYVNFLKEYLKFHGEKKLVKAFTEDSFYNRNQSIINDLFQNTKKEIISRSDSLVIAEFMKKDQEIRFTGRLTKETDSLNQISIKKIIAQKKYNNKHLQKAIKLLIRHASPNYLTEYKESGLLDHYASLAMLTKEEYYDAVNYITGKHYTPKYGGKEIDTINANRASAGLLPNNFNHDYIQYKSLFNRQSVNTNVDSLAIELLNYIDSLNIMHNIR